MNNFILDENGKPVFTGQEDPNNAPVSLRSGARIECPQCHSMVDYLLGENAGGGLQGCEGCYKPPTEEVKHRPEYYDKDKEIL